MNQGGRPRKPKAQKILEGTYRADRDSNAIPAPIADSVPDAPMILSAEGKRYFRLISRFLSEMNLLSNIDILVIQQLAQAMEINDRAYAEINESGYKQISNSGFETITAAYSVWEKTSKTIRELSNLLGLNPSARERIRIKAKEDDANTIDIILSDD